MQAHKKFNKMYYYPRRTIFSEKTITYSLKPYKLLWGYRTIRSGFDFISLINDKRLCFQVLKYNLQTADSFIEICLLKYGIFKTLPLNICLLFK